MSGTIEGGRKAAAKNLANDPLFYVKNGRKGGLNGVGKDYQLGGSKAAGFAANPTLAAISGQKGGRISRRRSNDDIEVQARIVQVKPVKKVVVKPLPIKVETIKPVKKRAFTSWLNL